MYRLNRFMNLLLLKGKVRMGKSNPIASVLHLRFRIMVEKHDNFEIL